MYLVWWIKIFNSNCLTAMKTICWVELYERVTTCLAVQCDNCTTQLVCTHAVFIRCHPCSTTNLLLFENYKSRLFRYALNLSLKLTVKAPHQGAQVGRSTPLAPPYLLLCFGNSVNRKYKCYHIWPLYLFYFDSETISGVGGLCFEGDD